MKIVLASNNFGKLKEFDRLFKNTQFEIIPQRNFNVTEAEETGLTFVENAILKARNACAQTNMPAIADDSGLEVDALNGMPGIFSARFAGVKATEKEHYQKLLDSLKNIPNEQKTARYRCVLVFLRHESDPSPIIAEGSLDGMIIDAPKGDGGFGYDPIFYLPDKCKTVSEITSHEKDAISHRGKAMRLLVERLTKCFKKSHE